MKFPTALVAALLLIFGGSGAQVVAEDVVLLTEKGKASYYGKGFHGRKTASGERFDQNNLTAAHPSWPFGTLVRVTNTKNGQTARVRVTDRGPAKKARRRGVVIDLSTRAAEKLGFTQQGKTQVRLDVLEWGVDRGKPKKKR